MRRRCGRLCGVAALALLPACSTLDYYGQLAGGQLAVLQAREPISTVLADPARDPQLRQRLAVLLQAREFASRHLHLPDNQSYRLYADIQRPYVVWNLFVTPPYALEPQLNCFPIAGCVAYRGYYSEARARGAAALQQQAGMDVWVAGVEAYSTLGWFDDPLLSSMLQRDDNQLAALIFHELAHQQLYLPGDTAFNESFASFVEQQGLQDWLASRGLPPANARRTCQRQQFSALVLASRERLQQLYASGRPVAELEQGKQAEFARLREDYRQLRDRQWQGEGLFDAWIAAPLNNAKLLPFGLYEQWVGAFAALYRQAGQSWPRFYRLAAQLAELPAAARQQRLALLQEQAGSADGCNPLG